MKRNILMLMALLSVGSVVVGKGNWFTNRYGSERTNDTDDKATFYEKHQKGIDTAQMLGGDFGAPVIGAGVGFGTYKGILALLNKFSPDLSLSKRRWIASIIAVGAGLGVTDASRAAIGYHNERMNSGLATGYRAIGEWNEKRKTKTAQPGTARVAAPGDLPDVV